MLYFDYRVVYYVRSSGRMPVKDFLNSLSKDDQEEIYQSINFLWKRQGRLPPPYTKHIYKKIWELRIKHKNRQHRIFYFLDSKRKIVLLSAFLKKSAKTPRAEIKKSHNYYLDYLSNIL